MPKLDIAHAKIKIDNYTIVSRGETNPVNWVEIELMWFQHGERAVSDILIVDSVEAENHEVLENLRLKYGSAKVKEAFPGQRPRLPMQAPPEFPRKGEAAPEPKRRSKPKKEAEAPATDAALADMMSAETPE